MRAALHWTLFSAPCAGTRPSLQAAAGWLAGGLACERLLQRKLRPQPAQCCQAQRRHDFEPCGKLQVLERVCALLGLRGQWGGLAAGRAEDTGCCLQLLLLLTRLTTPSGGRLLVGLKDVLEYGAAELKLHAAAVAGDVGLELPC